MRHSHFDSQRAPLINILHTDALAEKEKENRTLSKYKSVIAKNHSLKSSTRIPRPIGERAKPGGFQLQAVLGLKNDKPTYLAILVSRTFSLDQWG